MAGSEHELSGDYMFAKKAQEMGDLLLPAFQTPSGLPSTRVNLLSGAQSGAWAGAQTVILSEFGTLQLEFSYLSHVTEDPKYMLAAINVYSTLRKSRPEGGLMPTYFSSRSGNAENNQFTMGALSDSYYEYLLKIYILSEGTLPSALDMYVKAMDAMVEELVIEWVDPDSNEQRARLIQRDNGQISDRMEHLSCFVPGMLALGAQYGADHNIPALMARKEQHMDLAKKLTATCVSMYTMNKSGLAAEFIEFTPANVANVGRDARYLLRPETVESLFIMWRVTEDPIYREQGWKIYSAIETHCKTEHAYAAIDDVRRASPKAPQLDNMESFIVAETFKYLYLLFSPATLIPLDKFVFTTEAHPLRIMKRSRIMEKK